MEPAARDVRDLCRRALAGDLLGEPDLARLLAAHGEAAEAVFAAARAARARSFGDAVCLYGFVYFSTFCRNECTFCFYRAGNGESPRDRKSLDEVVAICRDLAGSGVVLLDLTMPRMDGEETYRELRRLNAKVPVILMSGFSEKDMMDRFADRELAGFLQKPFEREKLQAYLHGILDAQA